MFSKAQLKRFNDTAGCAPPVGAYDPKDKVKLVGGVIEKSNRFKQPKDVGSTGSLGPDATISFQGPVHCSTPSKGSNKSNNTSSSSFEVPGIKSSGPGKEWRLKEEVQSLQQLVRSKEREINNTQKQIVQAMRVLITDAEHCAKHSRSLNQLFTRLELSADVTEGEDDEKTEAGDTVLDFKQIDAQIKKARRLIKRVSGCVSSLAASGVDQLDVLWQRQEDQHTERFQQVSLQLADTQQQLMLQQQQHEHQMEEALRQRQEEYDRAQSQVGQLQQDCEEAQGRLNQTLQDYSTAQLRLQQCQEEHQSTQALMQQERDALESKLFQEQEVVKNLRKEQSMSESNLEKAHEALESALKERETDECKHKEMEVTWLKEVEELRETCLHTQQELNSVQEQLRLKEIKLKDLEETLLQKQVEHETVTQALQEDLQEIQQKLTGAERDLFQKQVQHEEALLQLRRLKESQYQLGDQLQESQESRIRMQQEIHHLQREEGKLKELVDTLKKKSDYLELHNETSRKELELKETLYTDTMQSLKAEAYTLSETGTPTKTTQLLFEEQAERAALEERSSQLKEENEILNLSIRDLTAKYEGIVHRIGAELMEERERLREVSARFSASESERETMTKDLHQTQLLNRDLVDSLNVFKDEVSSLKTANDGMKAAAEETETLNTQLRAEVKTLQLTLEQEQQAANLVRSEVQLHVEHLEVQNKQYEIANEALKSQLTQLTNTHNKETAELKEKCQSLSEDKQRQTEKHQEDLQSVRKALALDRQASDLQMEELHCKLERAQAFNVQMKEELKKVLKDNEKLKDDNRTEIAALQMKVETAEIQASEVISQSDLLRHQAKHAQAECTKLKNLQAQLEQSVDEKREEVGHLHQELDQCHTRLAGQETNLKELTAEKEALEEHLNRISGEHSLLETDMERQLQVMQAAALEEREEYERMMAEMSEKIQQLEMEQEQTQDSEEWKQKYEELFARVEPFMEQLDAFAAERTLLLGRSEMAEAEIGKMMDKYAKLLGHQNQKQKIQYINKLKDEFMQCRKEKEALKEKSNKQQTAIQKLEKKIQTLEGRKTFDPSQAFKHAKRKEDGPKLPSKHSEAPQGLKQAVRQSEVVRSPLKQSNK